MKNRVITTILSILLVVSVLFVSCTTGSESNYSKAENSSSGTTTDSSSNTEGSSGTFSSTIAGWITDEEAIKTVTPSEDQMPEKYKASDFEYNEDDYAEVEINLSSLSASYADGNITLAEADALLTITNGSENKYNIILSGTYSKGVRIKSDDSDYMLTLNGVTITSAADSDEQALNLKSDTTCFMVLEGTNTLTGCTGTETNAVKASGSLVISGDGTLNVYAETKNGIVSDDVVVINSGVINVVLNSSTSGGTGIKPVNGYVQNGGEVNITGLNETEGSENKGIKVDGDENETEYGAGKGYILVNGGKITVKTSGKGMTAGFDYTEDGDTSSSEYDPYADVFINNGLITITTTATPREDSSDTANDGVSPEGIEGKRKVIINGGKIILNTTDDCINASVDNECSVEINGGFIYAHSSQNDSIDSNGTIAIKGGVVIALGASAPEGGIDCDENSRFTYTGGTVIAMGGSNNLPSASGSTGYYLTTGNGSGNMGGGPVGDSTTPPELPDSSDMTPPDGDSGSTPPEKPDGTDSGLGEPPEKPEGDSTSAAPGGQPDGQPGGQPDGMGGETSGSLSAGNTLVLLDSDGNVIIAFTVPSGAVSSNVFIASSELKSGETYSISSSAEVKSEEYTFADVLSFGKVSVSVESSTSFTVSSKATSITL